MQFSKCSHFKLAIDPDWSEQCKILWLLCEELGVNVVILNCLLI